MDEPDSSRKVLLHIALFAWKQKADPETVNRALVDIKGMKKKIPGIIEIYCGENFSKWNQGFQHAVVVIAENQNALEMYRNHPDHVRVADLLDIIESKTIGIDIMDSVTK